MVRRPADRLHGHAHGSDERRVPHLVVPPEQITPHLPGPLQTITAEQAAERDLVTRAEVETISGMTPNQVRARVGLGRLVPVACLVVGHARGAATLHLYARADAEALT